MEYKKIENNNYNLHFINTNRFKTLTIEINFTKDLIENNISYYKILSKLLAYSNKKYNTRKKMAIKSEELYDSSLFSSSGVVGSLENLVVGVEFINHKYTNKKELKNNLELLHDSLLEPNVINGEFDNNIFNDIKDNVLTNIKMRKEYPSSIAYRNFETIMFKGSPASYDRIGNPKVITKLTSKDLYDFYLNLFSGYSINVLVYGEITTDDEIEITKYIDKILKRFKGVKSSEFNPFIKRKMSSKLTIKEDKKNVSQSNLIIGYDIVNIDKKKYEYALTLYNMILGNSSNSLLFMKVREEKSYCYSISSSIYRYSDALIICAGINRKNYNDCVKVIKDTVKLMSNKKIIEENLDKVKKMMNTRINDYYDSSASISDHYFLNEYDPSDDIEIQRKKYNEVSVTDILDINEHLKINTIYFLEGVKENEETNL